MATVFSEDFTGTNGAGWDSGRWPVTVAPGGAVTIQGNRGRIVTGAAGGYGDIAAAWSTVSETNAELLTRVYLPTGNPEFFLLFRLRWVDTGVVSDYHLRVLPYYGVVQLWRTVSGTETELASVSYTFTSGTPVWVRFNLLGPLIRAKVWNDGTGEPAGWTVATNDSSVTAAGAFAIGIVGGAAATARQFEFDDLTVITPQSPVALAPTASGDDGRQQNNSTTTNQNLTSTTVAIASNSSAGSRFNGGFRFPGNSAHAIKGKTITSAKLRLYRTTGTGWMGTIRGEAADNSPVFAASSGAYINQRSRTTAGVAVNTTSLSGTWIEFDVTAVVAEIVARSGWSDGNAITLLLDSDGTPNRSFTVRTWDDTSRTPPQLWIEYADPIEEHSGVAVAALVLTGEPVGVKATTATATGELVAAAEMVASKAASGVLDTECTIAVTSGGQKTATSQVTAGLVCAPTVDGSGEAEPILVEVWVWAHANPTATGTKHTAGSATVEQTAGPEAAGAKHAAGSATAPLADASTSGGESSRTGQPHTPLAATPTTAGAKHAADTATGVLDVTATESGAKHTTGHPAGGYTLTPTAAGVSGEATSTTVVAPLLVTATTSGVKHTTTSVTTRVGVAATTSGAKTTHLDVTAVVHLAAAATGTKRTAGVVLAVIVATVTTTGYRSFDGGTPTRLTLTEDTTTSVFRERPTHSMYREDTLMIMQEAR